MRFLKIWQKGLEIFAEKQAYVQFLVEEIRRHLSANREAWSKTSILLFMKI
jgi:hypothetical protein